MRTQATEHTEDEKSGTLMPISRILREGGRFDDAAGVLREWFGVSDASAATDAFCELLEASPAGLTSLEFTMDTKRHWGRNMDRASFDRIMALATEDHRRSAVLRINFGGHAKIGGARDPSQANARAQP